MLSGYMLAVIVSMDGTPPMDMVRCEAIITDSTKNNICKALERPPQLAASFISHVGAQVHRPRLSCAGCVQCRHRTRTDNSAERCGRADPSQGPADNSNHR